MIGITIKSFRHLYRMCTAHLTPLFIDFQGNRNEICYAVRSKDEHGSKLMIFNSVLNLSNQMNINADEIPKEASRLKRIIIVRKNDEALEREYAKYISEMILLPTSFNEDYNNFIRENKKGLSKIMRDYTIDELSGTLQEIYMRSNGSKNFFLWAVKLFFTCGGRMVLIKNILLWNDLYNQLTNKLAKGSITAYTTMTAIDGLLKELEILRKTKRIADTINCFNTAQKKLLKSHDFSKEEKEALSKFSKLSERKKINFIKKVSSIDDYDELMRQMKHLCSIHFDWSKKSFDDYLANVEGLNYKKIYEKGDVVLVEVFDYNTIKQLAKTTNWCISKNKTYWNNYIENAANDARQYLIFDFSKREDDRYSIIGFTVVYNKGITNAHDFINTSILGKQEFIGHGINSYISKFLYRNSIDTILENYGIGRNLIGGYDKPLYKWDRESVMSYLYECVNQENVDVIMSEGSKLVLSVKDRNINYFLGDAYYDNVASKFWEYQHILFLDFAIDEHNPNKLQYGIISRDEIGEDKCIIFNNESSTASDNTFESELIKFGLPYDTICRINNWSSRLCDSITTNNIDLVKECFKNLSKDEAVNIIQNTYGREAFYTQMSEMAIQWLSFDYVDIIYENGMTIHQIIGDKLTYQFVAQIVNDLVAYSKTCRNDFKVPSREEIENFYNGTLPSKESVFYVGSYILINKLLDNEIKDKNCSPNFIFSALPSNLRGFGYRELGIELAIKLGKILDFSTNTSASLSWAMYAESSNNPKLIELLEKAKQENKWLANFFSPKKAKLQNEAINFIYTPISIDSLY